MTAAPASDSQLSQIGLAAGNYVLAVGGFGLAAGETLDTSNAYPNSMSTSDGAYQLDLSGDASLAFAVNPDFGGSWGDPSGAAVVVDSGGGGGAFDALSGGDVVASVASVTDADSGDSFSYALTDDAGGAFDIDGATGEISVAGSGDVDISTLDGQSVTVQVTDSYGQTYSETQTFEFGSDSGETIAGGAGDDVIYGFDGADTLSGGAGDDVVFGGDGDDLLIARMGEGDDVLNGGAGSWTDTVQLQDAGGGDSIGTYGVDWTVTITQGSIDDVGSDTIELSDNADGVITLSDGVEIQFQDIEEIQW